MNPKNDQKKSSKEIRTSRRNFLKKAAYSAPTIVAMGYLTRPTSAMASNIDDRNGPGGGFGGNGFGQGGIYR